MPTTETYGIARLGLFPGTTDQARDDRHYANAGRMMISGAFASTHMRVGTLIYLHVNL